MNKLLRNPLVAIGLSIAAAVMLWFRVVAPLVGSPDFAVEDPPVVEQPAVEQPTAPISAEAPSVAPDPSVPTVNPAPTAAPGIPLPLARMGWKRKANRDPFLLEPRQGSMAWWITDSLPPAPRVRKPSAGGTGRAAGDMYSGLLRAVAIGPWGAKALLDNRIVTEGDSLRAGRRVGRITTESVTIARDSSQTKLTFRNGGNP